MRPFTKSFRNVILLLSIGIITGCATQVVETPAQITPPTVRLSTFNNIILSKAEIAPTYSGHSANVAAANKIDRVILSGLSNVFAGKSKLKQVDSPEEATAEDGKTLLIKPVIKQIKFIGGAARFWVGAMAGSSVVIMDVEYIDLNSGKQIGIAGFRRTAHAYSGVFGIADNRMLSDVGQDVILFTRSNL